MKKGTGWLRAHPTTLFAGSLVNRNAAATGPPEGGREGRGQDPVPRKSWPRCYGVRMRGSAATSLSEEFVLDGISCLRFPFSSPASGAGCWRGTMFGTSYCG